MPNEAFFQQYLKPDRPNKLWNIWGTITTHFGTVSPLSVISNLVFFFYKKNLLFRPNPNIPNMILVDNDFEYSHHASLVGLFTKRLVPSHSHCKYLLFSIIVAMNKGRHILPFNSCMFAKSLASFPIIKYVL